MPHESPATRPPVRGRLGASFDSCARLTAHGWLEVGAWKLHGTMLAQSVGYCLAGRVQNSVYERCTLPKKETKGKLWVREVKTVSTSPPEGLFTKDAATIAKTMASKKVSPKGIGSGIRMIQYFINRAGKGLSAARRRELEKAKQILQERAHKQK